VGVSGGADSIALLHLLVDAGFRNLVVCHLNHRLRGAESSGDARFVKRLASNLDLPCECGSSDVRRLMRASKTSLETAARMARHAFFADCARKHRCRRLLLAHHADDQAETVLWNLLRGSRGPRGMKPQQQMMMDGVKLTVMRPLLSARRADLHAWLIERNLSWREDATNSEAIGVRNRIRNEALPLLARITGRDPIAALVRAAADMAEIDAMEHDLVAAARVTDPSGRLHIPVLRTLPTPLQRRALHEFLIGHGIANIDRALLDRALDLLDSSAPASVNLPGDRRMRRRGGRLWIDDA
jgi:tRNA(Ile)-lysidine synthase